MSQQAPAETAKDVAQEVSKKETAKQVFAEFQSDDVTGLAAEVAYHLIFSLAPLLIFMISMAAVVDTFTGVDVAGQLEDLITENAPSDIQAVLIPIVQDAIANADGGVASFGALSSALLALWAGSNALGALMKAFNRAYDVEEERPLVKKKLVSIGLTVMLGLFVNVAFVLFVFGGDIGAWIADWFGLGSVFDWVWNISRYPIAFILIAFLLALLYYFGPNVEQSFAWISAGSIIATFLWVAVVFGFQIYLTFSNPGSAYGTFGSIIVLLFFLYVTSIVFLLGAEINAVLSRSNDPATIADLNSGRERAGSPGGSGRTGKRARQEPVVQPIGMYGPDVPHERSARTKVIALGAVGAAAAFMLGNKVKGILGR